MENIEFINDLYFYDFNIHTELVFKILRIRFI